MRVKTIIVDDELPICDEIEYLLKRERDIEIAAKFTNALEAMSYLMKNACDLIFLDIQMPGMSGLDFAQKLTSLQRPPLIVFCTAFPEHALAAFETPAIGYITKPITETSLKKVLEKARAIGERINVRQKLAVSRFCVTKNGKYIPLDLPEIVFVYVKDKEVYIRTKGEEYTSSLTIQEIENLLPEQSFLRVHRQYLVNLDKIGEIVPWFHGSYLLRMEDIQTTEIPVSRNKTKELKCRVGLP
ncbi:two-component system response regulator [Anaerosporomusa subterranea]|uniref:Two-component system response regulator n=1 Tax=Anaerosporomusa subterranea TaxID=1794912 RepID=A0A154BQU2_ANASB|nr:LytTR family DNA-binding domain-containing protein [Anaerosporomusa subterranea]KYZ75878.1 two-component system response regulator [Anaerosporomusa subterranea]